MTDFRALISLPAKSAVEFVIVGNAAVTAHGNMRFATALRRRMLLSRTGTSHPRQARRPKDLEAIAELEAILEEHKRSR